MVLAVAAAAFLLGGAGDTNTPDDAGPRYFALPQAPALPDDALHPLPAFPQDGPPAADAIPAPPRIVTLPTIQTSSALMELGLLPDGTLEVPPASPSSPAGWYSGSPSPGEPGPAILLGHVNADDGGPGVFARLRSLLPGDEIAVGRDDGTESVFTVVRGERYAKDLFPTEEVYGNTPGPELRLITCDGFDSTTGLWQDNYVVYAVLKDAD
ncbi:sortase domain-bontaining protein [Arthrobacter koreensis]|uniref:Sortase n=1 Tax=Arthrobacter koreensis TaxID=199136 RepID=A0ABY6FU69_9MICC|nr:sortase [Arthrobacter koreensis]UYB36773.1 sortase [Arthrobacter koreensis]